MIKSSRKRWLPFPSLVRGALDNGVVPAPRLLLAALLGAVPVAASWAAGYGWNVFWAYNGALLLLSLADLWLIPPRRAIAVQRTLPEKADLLQPFEVALTIANRSGQAVSVEIIDDAPAPFRRPAPMTVRLQPGAETVHSYRTQSDTRGSYTFTDVTLRYGGGLGLWRKQLKLRQPQQIRIIPDLSGVRGYLASRQESLILNGSRVYKKAHAGSEFDSIREYVPGDDPRYVNWRATARSGHLMTNVYRPERGKIITLLLDCGRMMGVTLQEGNTKLDLALEAALTMAAVALRQGDQVAALAFSSDMKAYVPPGRGLAHLSAITDAVYDLKSDYDEADYRAALAHIGRMQQKRGLLVLFSDMDNYLAEDQLAPYLLRLRRGHRLLLTSIQDGMLNRRMREDDGTSRSAYIRGTAMHMALKRRSYQRRMSSLGIEVLDVPAKELTLHAVNHYLSLKSREAL